MSPSVPAIQQLVVQDRLKPHSAHIPSFDGYDGTSEGWKDSKKSGSHPAGPPPSNSTEIKERDEHHEYVHPPPHSQSHQSHTVNQLARPQPSRLFPTKTQCQPRHQQHDAPRTSSASPRRRRKIRPPRRHDVLLSLPVTAHGANIEQVERISQTWETQGWIFDSGCSAAVEHGRGFGTLYGLWRD